MTDKTVINDKLDQKELAERAAQEKQMQEKLGHKDDGHYVILEMDQSSGAQTLISAPNLSIPIKEADDTQAHDPETGEPLYQWQALVFSHPEQAKEWIRERGEKGFSYLILSAVDALMGERTAEELEAVVQSDAAAMQEAVEQDQEDRK